MSSLTFADKQYLERILNMSGGYVLDFTDATFADFFRQYEIDIHSQRYQASGTSKARKLRAFWNLEIDLLVGRVMSAMLDTYEANCDVAGSKRETELLAKCREIAGRLSQKADDANSTTDEAFLRREFDTPNVQKLPVDFAVSEIIEDRLEEARSCLSVGAHLSVIFQCGSILESVLLGAAQKMPEKFNRSSVSPKQNGKVKAFHDWTLAEFINVAHDIGLLKPDVQKFSHGLREFRNYIHPYQQMTSGFKPDEHTAKVCIQVLRAALADVAGDR